VNGVVGGDKMYMVLSRRGLSLAMRAASAAAFSWHRCAPLVEDTTRRATPAAHDYGRLQTADL